MFLIKSMSSIFKCFLAGFCLLNNSPARQFALKGSKFAEEKWLSAFNEYRENSISLDKESLALFELKKKFVKSHVLYIISVLEDRYHSRSSQISDSEFDRNLRKRIGVYVTDLRESVRNRSGDWSDFLEALNPIAASTLSPLDKSEFLKVITLFKDCADLLD